MNFVVKIQTWDLEEMLGYRALCKWCYTTDVVEAYVRKIKQGIDQLKLLQNPLIHRIPEIGIKIC